MSRRVGIDIGGTFTDFALIDDQAESTRVHKVLTTADDPSRAVVQGLDELLVDAGLQLADIDLISHGTTLVTNAVIERRGARVGMIVTKGFADIVDMARETRYDLFNLRLRYAEPLVPRTNRIEVEERTSSSGAIEQGVGEAKLVDGLRDAVERAALEAVAICLINSYRDSANEETIRRLVKREFPDIYVSVSSEVASSIKEYERWTTTLVNAYTQPLIDAYIGRLETALQERGFAGALRIMTSSGGSFDGALARALPVRLIESGPAAGVLMAAKLASHASMSQVLAFDMGGTTAKGAFIRNGRPIKKYEFEVAREHQFRPGSGLPVRVPVVDMIEIGSGGGSIAHVDTTGLVKVGPRSASANPGPACYGLGGKKPTLTDANLLLGFLDADYFLGGEMTLQPRLSEAVMQDTVCKDLGINDIAYAANGVREIASEDVAAAFRTHAAELGLDVRNSIMVAFGGSGPLIATSVARKLRIHSVLFPAGAGVFSAIGLLVSPASFETSRSLRIGLAALSVDRIAEVFSALRESARSALVGMGVSTDTVIFEEFLDLRYVGQGHQVRINLPARSDNEVWATAIRAAFESAYASTFGIRPPLSEIEITDWRVVASENRVHDAHSRPVRPVKNQNAQQHRSGTIWHKGQYSACTIVDRYRCRPGDQIAGPALVQDAESTCVLLPSDRGVISPQGDIHVQVGLD